MKIKNEKFTGETDGSVAVNGSGARAMSDERQFSEISAFGDAAHFHLQLILAHDDDAHRARLDKVHAVSGFTLAYDARSVVEGARIEGIGQVHPLVRLLKKKLYVDNSQRKIVKQLPRAIRETFRQIHLLVLKRG